MATHPRRRVIKSTHKERHERRVYEARRSAVRREAEETGAPCEWCGRPIDYTLPGRHPEGFTADHVTPRSKDGTHEVENLRPMHNRCNAQRCAGGRNANTPRRVDGVDRSATW